MPDWLDALDPDERSEWDRFVEHTRRHTIEGMTKSAFVMSLVPSKDRLDVKFAVELGLAVMLDKPILAVVMPGAEVPARLRQVADRIVEADLDTEDGMAAVAAAIREFTGR
jgi:nucleoside 2-deoxyribosyltransferase